MAKLCLALDLPLKDAKRLACHLEGYPLILKVGPGLLMDGGKEFIGELLNMGYEIFLDLKLHDIPNTVGIAVSTAEELGVSYLTLHTLGGREMLREGVRRRKDMKLIGVSLLTSHGEDYLEFIRSGFSSTEEAVMYLSGIAKECGLDGIVCSPLEVEEVKREFNLITVVPGIRIHQSKGDQRRTATPSEAVRKGADIIVVGREITASKDPVKSLEEILHEVSEP
jgi:orotidine-5'-phosphate decarboxylase